MNTFDSKQADQYYKLLDQVSLEGMKQHLELIDVNIQTIRKKRQKRVVQLSMAAILSIIIFFVSGVTISSGFAEAISKINLFKPIIEFIDRHKTIVDIVENDYYETINASQTIDGITLTVTNVIADESGMIVLYRLESDKDLADIYRSNVHVELLQGGQVIEDVMITSGWYPLSEGTFYLENSIEVSAPQAMDYSDRRFTLNLSLTELSFEVPFILEKDIIHSKQIIINKDIMIDNQKITVHALKISPLKSELQLSISKNNSKKILQFNELVIYDERGEEWGRIHGGVTEFSSLAGDNITLFFESNYFRIPEKVTIEFKEIEAIDKEDAYIEVDFSTMDILYLPNILDINLQLMKPYTLAYSYSRLQSPEATIALGNLVDADGKVYYNNFSSYRGTDDDVEIEQSYSESQHEEPLVNPVTVEVTRFNQFLEGSARLEVEIQ